MNLLLIILLSIIGAFVANKIIKLIKSIEDYKSKIDNFMDNTGEELVDTNLLLKLLNEKPVPVVKEIKVKNEIENAEPDTEILTEDVRIPLVGDINLGFEGEDKTQKIKIYPNKYGN